MRIPRAVAAGSLLALCSLSAGCAEPGRDEAGDEECDDTGCDESEYEEEDPSAGEWIVGALFEIAFDAMFSAEDDSRPGFFDGLDLRQERRVRADLVRTEGEPDPDARGVIVVARRGRETRLAVAAKGLDAFVVRLWLIDPEGDADFVTTLSVADGGLMRELSLDPRLVEGRGVDLVDDRGTPVLRGAVPALHSRPARTRTLRLRDPESDARGTLRVRSGGAGGREVLDLRIAGLDPLGSVDLLVGDSTVPAASGTTDGRGRWTLLRDSRRGDPGPAGAEGGAAFEVRCGAVRLTGEVPVLSGGSRGRE